MTGDSPAPNPDRRGRWLLALGAALGILVALASAIKPAGRGLPADAVAAVNDRIVSAEELARALDLLARDKRNEMTDEDRAFILDRLIDEELLVQRGVELGLVDSDQSIRKAVVKAMMDSILLDAESEQPTEEQLRAFYRDNQDYFARPPTLRARQILFRNRAERADGLQRAEQAAAALAGGISFADAVARFGDAPIQPIPDTLLPARALREYIGPTALETLMSLRAGERTPPIPSPFGYQILELVEREGIDVPAFESVAEQVEAAYIRRAGEKALRAYLDRLRDEASVRYGTDAPRP
ncbi:MAG TPA: peptidylprolyl isomerase [Candidatus Binatia bacterium]|nr:peptidylprolyl isomerase [Candidatus Binatia bacterium]